MYGRYSSISTRMILTLVLIVRKTSRSCRIDQLVVYATQYTLCPNGRKKSHCMLVRRAAWSQLCLGVKIGRNVHTARFNGRKCSYRPQLDCPRLTTHSHATRLFPPIWTQIVVCTSSDMVAM